MSKAALIDVLMAIPAGQVQTVLCERVTDALIEMTTADFAPLYPARVVTHTWEKLPESALLIEEMLAAIADVALNLWPTWYRKDDLFVHSAGTIAADALFNRYVALDLQTSQEGLCLPWLKAAVQACQTGQRPVFKTFSHSLQLAQLALTINPGHLMLALLVTDPHPLEHRLLGLAQAARWLADQTHAPVALLVPHHWVTANALNSVLYGAITWAELSSTDAVTDAIDETKHIVFPLYGRPHPLSPGEQKLAEGLSKDPELAPLFQFNQRVETIRSTHYLVDLLWRQGRLVIEVDGYRYHGNRFAFECDRNRDYELLISGYIVLRLTHAQVCDDPAIAIEKIRDVVRFRRSQL